ncbi:MAG: FHA domain-containing protein [Arthrobacter sp.]
MSAVRYIPGTWLGIVRSRTAVLLEPDTQPALIATLWDLLQSRPEEHEVLHAVTSGSGGSLANIPSFGILDFDGPLRVFLRGDLDVTVQSSGGAVELHGRDVTTWTERRLGDPGLCRLTIPAAAGELHHPYAPTQPGAAQPTPRQPRAGFAELPLGEGVVLLQSLVLALGSGFKAAGVTGPSAACAVVSPPSALAAAPLAAAAAAPPVIGPSPRAAAAPAASVPVSAPVIEESPQATDLPEITVAPEHGASAETVYAVIDEDFDAVGAPGTHPDAGTDPGAATEVAASHAASQEHSASGAAGQAAAEVTSSYDHLWERTVVRSIEDAAVREDPEADSAAPEHPVKSPAAAALVDGKGAATTDAPPAVVLDAPSAASAGAAALGPATGGLIDAVPWRTADAGSGPATPPVVPPPMLPPVPAAAPSPPVTPAPDAGHGEYGGDHDGQTVMKGSLGRVAATPVREATDASAAAGPLVLARLCPQGHTNPPTSSICANCGAGLLPDAVQVARPRLGRMRISTGDVVDLDQSLVIGRQPSVSRVQGGVMPRLVQVASPGGDISRSHVEVRLEGWHVMLCDLKATNGTVLVRQGQPPRRLAQNEMAILLDGDIAELGENISLRFEEIP